MKYSARYIAPAFVLFAVIIAHAQQPQKQTPDDVLRVNTDLVQSAITVVDKNGHFVDGLRQEDFVLLVDGKPRPIGFFDRVTAGSPREHQLFSKSVTLPPPNVTPVDATARGRTIVFFIDDMHMSADSLHRTRDMLRRFLTTEMSTDDSVVIATASGQIGFLEQFTNNEQVLNAAVDRLIPRQYDVHSFGTGATQMREFDALIIDTTESKKANSEVLNYYIRECVVQSNPPKQASWARTLIAASCETEVRNSARAVLLQAAKITENMYATLQSLMHSAARAPGRKLAFFISDGFLLDAGPHAPGLRDQLDKIIDAARRAGVVIYSIDSRGLTNEDVDVRQGNARMDFGAPVGEAEARQDAMNALAGDTGGRALRNANFFDRWVGAMLDETSNYYLIAWRPENDQEKVARFRNIKIEIAGHPELVARAPRGYVEGPAPATVAPAEKTSANHALGSAETQLRDALADYYPSVDLTTTLSLTYLNTPKNEMLLNSSIQIGTDALGYGSDGKQPAQIKIAGVILNDKGKIAGSFKNQLSVAPMSGADSTGIIYNEHTPLAPGIYQVRAAARDEASGRVGSAIQWIVIPDLTKRQLTTSSILLGATLIKNDAKQSEQIQFSVDHRFFRTSPLRYWIFIYNAARKSGEPHISIQSEVLRNGQKVMSGVVRNIASGGSDPDRVAFGDELSLASLAPGKYELRVTVTDQSSGAVATQQTEFEIR